jgi:hypothetical protein
LKILLEYVQHADMVSYLARTTLTDRLVAEMHGRHVRACHGGTQTMKVAWAGNVCRQWAPDISPIKLGLEEMNAGS